MDEFGEYMLRHIEEWFTFARERGMGICRREDIVLVTGRDLAKSWANIVFREGDGDMTFEARVTGDFRMEWKFTPEGARGVAHAIGPNGNLKVYFLIISFSPLPPLQQRQTSDSLISSNQGSTGESVHIRQRLPCHPYRENITEASSSGWAS